MVRMTNRSRDDYLGAGEHCWIRSIGADPCGHYLHTEESCPNILASPGVPKRYALADWAGKKPQCPVCHDIATNRLRQSAQVERSRLEPARRGRSPAPSPLD